MIRESSVIEIVRECEPVLAGTLPLDLFTEGSDLDILCYSSDLSFLEKLWVENFHQHPDFSVQRKSFRNVPTLIGRFSFENFSFELFAQAVPTHAQTAYLHLVKEFLILEKYGDDFRQKILRMKRQGVKTEPAFASLLNLDGDPYDAILNYSV